MFYKKILFLLFYLYANIIFSQQTVNFNISLPEILTADAGCDQYLTLGQIVALGGYPAAIGGTPPYSYCWSPGLFLNDSTIANPNSSPQHNISYTLQIIDGNNCTSSDIVNIYIPSVNIENNNVENDDIYYVLYDDIINVFLPDKINIDNNIQIYLYDISGRLINSDFSIINNNLLTISTLGLKNIGILYIKSFAFSNVIKIVAL